MTKLTVNLLLPDPVTCPLSDKGAPSKIHRYVKGVPVALTKKVAMPPSAGLSLAGCVVMDGDTSTVTVATVLVAEP